jgi:hypothetical protein
LIRVCTELAVNDFGAKEIDVNEYLQAFISTVMPTVVPRVPEPKTDGDLLQFKGESAGVVASCRTLTPPIVWALNVLVPLRSSLHWRHRCSSRSIAPAAQSPSRVARNAAPAGLA